MSDVAEQLLAAIEETERIARAIPGDLRQHRWEDPGPWIMHGHTSGACDEIAKVADGVPMPIAEKLAAHIARHDPRSELIRCAVDRWIVELAATETDETGGRPLAIRVLALLAKSYGLSDNKD